MQVAGGVFDPKTGTFHISPEAQADAEARRENTRQMTEFRIAQLEWQKENANLNRQQREDLAREQAQLRREIAGMNDATRREIAASRPSTGGAGNTKAREKADEKEAFLANVDEAITLAENNPGAFTARQRYGSALPGAAQGAVTANLTESELQTRIKIADVAGAKVKERYGAALAGHEERRANQYLPAPTDTQAQAIAKLKQLREYMDVLDRKYQKGRYSVPGASTATPAPGAPPSAGGWKLVP
jgi:hypothetical protein